MGSSGAEGFAYDLDPTKGGAVSFIALITSTEDGLEPYGLFPLPEELRGHGLDAGRCGIYSLEVCGEYVEAFASRNEPALAGPDGNPLMLFPEHSPLSAIAERTGGALALEPFDMEAAGASWATLDALYGYLINRGAMDPNSTDSPAMFIASINNAGGALPVTTLCAGILGEYAQAAIEYAEAPKKTRHYGKKIRRVDSSIDPVTRAMHKRGKGCVSDAYYFDLDGAGDGMGKAIQVKTGPNQYAELRVGTTVEDAEIAPSHKYRLNAVDQFYMEVAASMIDAGNNEVLGSQILRACGYKNPYTSQKEIEEALESFMKMKGTPFIIDNTHARRGATANGRTVRKNIRIRSYGNYDIEVEWYETEDGEKGSPKDFKLVYAGSAEDVFPVLETPRLLGQITPIDICDFTQFKTLYGVKMSDIQMFHYVLSQVRTHGMSNVIKFENMFSDLQLLAKDEADGSAGRNVKRKKERHIKRLKTMLDEKSSNQSQNRLFAGWESTHDSTGTEDGVKIIPLQSDKKLPRDNTRGKRSR